MTEKLIYGIFRRVNRGRVRDVLTGKIHESFTVAADQLFQRGYMTEEERIALSGVIGDVLPKFQEGIDDNVGNRTVDTDDLRAIAEKSFVRRTHSRSKCMQCDNKPTVACHWANGHGMAWFCKKHFKEWLEEDDRDICGVWVLEEGECPDDIRKTPKGTEKVRKLGDDISQKEIYQRIDELTKRGGAGSGHHDHKGRPGEVGGSQKSDIDVDEPVLFSLGGKTHYGWSDMGIVCGADTHLRANRKASPIGNITDLEEVTCASCKKKLQERIKDHPLKERGGPGSGHHGHRGVTGQTGGSLPRSKGTYLGGLGVPDMKDASKRSFVSQRIMQVDDEAVVALVSLRRLDVFKTKPYRLESRWYVKDRKGPATEGQQDAGADLLKELEVSTVQVMEVSGWERSTYRDNLWVAPWDNALRLPVELITRPYSNVPESQWGAMDRCVEKVMAKGKTKERAIAICYSSIVERKIIDEVEEETEPAEETPEQEIVEIVEEPPVIEKFIEDEIPKEDPLPKKEEKVIDRAKGMFRRVRRAIERHHGPGPHPGTGTPQDVHGDGGGGKTAVGVTSARPGKASGQVFEEMRSFADELNGISTIKNVSVTPGLGGWQGGRESTWVVSYEGNGDAMRLIARTAQLHEQEGVLFTRPGGDEPVSSFAFSDAVTPNERDEVESLLGEVGIGGWQWFRLPSGNPTLRIVNVPQYGGDAESHRQAMEMLTQMFDAIEMPHEFNEVVKKVDILEAEGSYGYDTILEE